MKDSHYFVKILLIFFFFLALARAVHAVLSPVRGKVPCALGTKRCFPRPEQPLPAAVVAPLTPRDGPRSPSLARGSAPDSLRVCKVPTHT